MGLPTAENIYSYRPSLAASILFNILYGGLIIPHFTLSCYRCRHKVMKHRYTICLLVAAIISTAGYSIRTPSIENPSNVGLYAASASLIVISPIFVCATLYLLLARLIQLYLPARHQTFFHVSPRLLGKLFITSDVISFMTQGSGSGIAASGNWQGNSRTVGVDVLLVGLALQLATFTFFLVVTWRFVCRVRVTAKPVFNTNLTKVMTGVWIAAFFVEVSRCFPICTLSVRRAVKDQEWRTNGCPGVDTIDLSCGRICTRHRGVPISA